MYLVRTPLLIRKLIPSAVWRMDKNQKKIYLSFDDGPVPVITPWVLTVLKEHEIKATFFCVGENIQKHPEVFQEIVKGKHGIGNHTFNHLKGWKTHTKHYIRNVEKCNEIVSQTYDQGAKKLFRPPYGKIKKNQLKTLNSDYSIVMWDVLSGDYDKKTSPEMCLKNVVGNVRNGSIIVFHDSEKAKKNLAFALPRFIVFAKEQGFEFEVLH